LISDESDRLPDIGIKVNRRTVDHVRLSFLIHDSVSVMCSFGQATGNGFAFCALVTTVLSWARDVGLTEGESWHNDQNR
jgi:hypothetical protein